jgi:hypothetical protein
MVVHLKHFPEYRLSANIYSGAATNEDMLHNFQQLDPGSDWLAYFDETADLSNIEVADLPALKRVMAEKETAPGGEARRAAFVNLSGPNELFVDFWRHYATKGVGRPRPRAKFDTVEAACRWLGQPPAACEAIAKAVADVLAHPEGDLQA